MALVMTMMVKMMQLVYRRARRDVRWAMKETTTSVWFDRYQTHADDS